MTLLQEASPFNFNGAPRPLQSKERVALAECLMVSFLDCLPSTSTTTQFLSTLSRRCSDVLSKS